MTVTIFTTTDRLPYLQANMNVTVLDVTDNDSVKISIDVHNPTDVLEIFHAGIRYGLDKMEKILTK